MITKFISISDASKMFNVSSNTIRKIVRTNKDTEHVKTEQIRGKHGFKYVVSIDYLDSIYNSDSEPKTDVKNDFKSSNQNNQIDNQINNQIDNQIKQLNKQVDNQNNIIDKLTDTIQEQNKIIVSQSMQIYQLTTTTEQQPPSKEQNNSNFEKIIISILIVCIIIVIAYLLS